MVTYDSIYLLNTGLFYQHWDNHNNYPNAKEAAWQIGVNGGH